MREGLKDREYLGDGVYVGHDNFHIVLWLESESAFGPNAIALEPAVMGALQRYIDRVTPGVEEVQRADVSTAAEQAEASDG